MKWKTMVFPGMKRLAAIHAAGILFLAFLPAARATDVKGIPEITNGELMAAAYIAAEFDRLGLDPAGDEGSYFQNFTLPRGFTARPDTSLEALRGRRTVRFVFGKEIYPLPSSAAGAAEGEAVFAGYGISAPDLGYDDYADVDVRGKVVIVLRGIPNSRSSKNPFSTPAAQRRYGTFKAKQDTAAGLGAAGMVLVNDPAHFSNRSKDVLVTSSSRGQGTLPCLHATCRAGRRLLSGTGLSLDRIQKRIDGRPAPYSRALKGLTLRLRASLEMKKLYVRNVMGRLRAESPDRKDEVIIVGAHFDHIGRGEFGSMGGPKAKGQVHNGADDNASGSAAVMELAGYLKPRARELKRDVLFVCFTAEEMGLLGSHHYVETPVTPLEKTAAMINLDMVSYLSRTGRLLVYGTGTSPPFDEILRDANSAFHIKVKPVEGVGSGRSDHYPFYQKGIPVLFFFTGLHKNYHRPTDDVKYLDKRGFEKVVRLAGNTILALASLEERPTFTRAAETGVDTGPYLGIGLESREGGVYVASLKRGSPADRGGIRKGDRILEVNSRSVESVPLFYALWSGILPGTKVEFQVRRRGRVRTLRIQLKRGAP